MASRYKSRQRALQVLFQWDIRKIPIEEAVEHFYHTLHAEDLPQERLEKDEFMERLVNGTTGALEQIDQRIQRNASHWRLERMAAVERNILRLAVYEMERLNTAPAVVIDQALELTKRFAGEEAAPFVNGVLDAARRELEKESMEADSDRAPSGAVLPTE